MKNVRKFDKYYFTETSKCDHEVWILVQDNRIEQDKLIPYEYKVKCINCGKEIIETRKNIPLPAMTLSNIIILPDGTELYITYSQIKAHFDNIIKKAEDTFGKKPDTRFVYEILAKTYSI